MGKGRSVRSPQGGEGTGEENDTRSEGHGNRGWARLHVGFFVVTGPQGRVKDVRSERDPKGPAGGPEGTARTTVTRSPKGM